MGDESQGQCPQVQESSVEGIETTGAQSDGKLSLTEICVQKELGEHIQVGDPTPLAS